MSLKTMVQNYKKPTPMRWRKVGDYILILTCFIQANLPMLPLSDKVKIYTGMVVNFIGISLKFWTNTKKDDTLPVPEVNNDTDTEPK